MRAKEDESERERRGQFGAVKNEKKRRHERTGHAFEGSIEDPILLEETKVAALASASFLVQRWPTGH